MPDLNSVGVLILLPIPSHKKTRRCQWWWHEIATWWSWWRARTVRNQPCSTKVMDLKRFFHLVTFVYIHALPLDGTNNVFQKQGGTSFLHLSSRLFAKYVSSRGYPYIWGHGQLVTRHCSTNEKVRLCLSRYNNNNNILNNYWMRFLWYLE